MYDLFLNRFLYNIYKNLHIIILDAWVGLKINGKCCVNKKNETVKIIFYKICSFNNEENKFVPHRTMCDRFRVVCCDNMFGYQFSITFHEGTIIITQKTFQLVIISAKQVSNDFARRRLLSVVVLCRYILCFSQIHCIQCMYIIDLDSKVDFYSQYN